MSDIGYETYLFKIRKLLEYSTRDIARMRETGNEFYSVGFLGDCGEEQIFFYDFFAAKHYYLLLRRSYKAIYIYSPDGSRSRMEKTGPLRHPFDYAAPIKDIYKVPCMKLLVNKSEAFAHFADAVYCYKLDHRRKVWNLVEITH